MKKEIIKATWLGVFVVVAGCASDELLKPKTRSADVPAPEPGTQAYYELKIKGKYALDGGELVPIIQSQGTTTLSSRLPPGVIRPTSSVASSSSSMSARWLEGPIMQVISNNLAVVGKPITNLSGAVTLSRTCVVAVADAQQVTIGEVRRMLSVPTGRYSYVTKSNETGTLSAYREVPEPTYDEYLQIYNRDRQSAPYTPIVSVVCSSAESPTAPQTSPVAPVVGSPQIEARQALLTEGDYTYAYTVTNGTATICARGKPGYVKEPSIDPYPSGALEIPAVLGGAPVVAIGDSAFYSFGSDSLISVTIPGSVTNLGDMSFGGCAGLLAVYFEGDAPHVIVRNPRYNTFIGSPDDCVVYVPTGSTGWDGNAGSAVLPEMWHGKKIKTYSKEEKATNLHRLLPEIRQEVIGDITYSYTVVDGKATLVGNWSKTAKRNINNVRYPMRDLALSPKPSGSLTLPSSLGGCPVTAIGNRALYGCAGLSDAVVPEGIVSIGKEAFGGCSGLTSVTLPKSLAVIGGEAFYFCSSLRMVHIPKRTETIGESAFSRCTNLTAVTVEEGNARFVDVEGVLYDNAVTNLIYCPPARQEIVIPDSATAIPGYRFQNYKTLSSLVLSRNVASVTPEVFKGWTGLASITVAEGNPYFTVHDGVLYDKAMKTLIRCPPAREGEIVIPAGVETIANVAFADCDKLTRITIPEGVRSIGGLSSGQITGAFFNCSQLTEITIPASVEYLGYCTFGRCRNLKRAFYKGNAPKSGNGVFWSTDATVYYLAGTTGWGSEYDKRPTSLWDPEMPLPPLALPSETTSDIPVATLKVGDLAPALQQGKYVQGEPVAAFEKGKVYVIEFWSTWCGPCRSVIPHVDKLQEKFKDRGLVVIGQNVWQRDEDVEGDVTKFVREMGADMTYRVALDRDGAMSETWMKAAGRKGIPSAFVVDQEGKVAWIGHPGAGLDEALATLLAK